MNHITNPATRRRLALGLTVPPPPPSANRSRGDAIIAAATFWLAGFISALAAIILTGR